MSEHFTLVDRTGKVHHYELELHDGVAGWKIYQRVAAILAPVIGTGLLTLVGGGKGLDLDVAELAASGGVGPALQSAIMGFDERLVADLLRHVLRDDRPMASDGARAQAYQGNYDELSMALLKVVEVNGFCPASEKISTVVAGARRQMGQALSDDGASSKVPPAGG